MDTRPGRWREQVALAPYTTFQVGGPADWFCEVDAVADLQEAVQTARNAGGDMLVLGGGSNVLVSDEGVRGSVIRTSLHEYRVTEEGDHVLVTVGAGMEWDALVERTVADGYWGLENLSAIPGSVGATPVQNVGAYGVEVADVIASVTVYDARRDVVCEYTPEQCAFGYRDSVFKHGAGAALVVLSVTFRLARTPRPRLHYRDLALWFQDTPQPSQREIRSAVTAIRKQKFPDWQVIGTAGSFFKNPIITKAHYHKLKKIYPEMPQYPWGDDVKVPLGWILEHVCTLRGVREGNVGTYEGQALVIVNYGGATASEVDAFARIIEERVKGKTDIDIEREVTMVGEWSS